MNARPLHRTLVVLAVGSTLLLAACGNDDGDARDADSAGTSAAATSSSVAGTASATTSDPASESPSVAESSSAASTPLTTYYVGTTPSGPRLFAETEDLGAIRVSEALLSVSQTPIDPDYRTLWPTGVLLDVSQADGQIDVTMNQSGVDRPAGMSQQSAELAIQQVVYTMQTALGEKVPVRFLVGDAPTSSVLGVSTPEAVRAAAPLKTLALVNVLSPVDGDPVSGTLTASGVASTFEGSVPWRVLDSTGKAVLHGSAQTAGDFTSVSPWQADVDTSGLAPGDYTFVASTGRSEEGPRPTRDTKSFTIS